MIDVRSFVWRNKRTRVCTVLCKSLQSVDIESRHDWIVLFIRTRIYSRNWNFLDHFIIKRSLFQVADFDHKSFYFDDH